MRSVLPSFSGVRIIKYFDASNRLNALKCCSSSSVGDRAAKTIVVGNPYSLCSFWCAILNEQLSQKNPCCMNLIFNLVSSIPWEVLIEIILKLRTSVKILALSDKQVTQCTITQKLNSSLDMGSANTTGTASEKPKSA